MSYLEFSTPFSERDFLKSVMDDLAEKIAKENDSKATKPEIDRRTGKDRRIFTYTVHVPERRSGLDRRETGWYRN